MNVPIQYGLIGCGGFGQFCLQEYRQAPDVMRCLAVADADPGLASRVAEENGLEWCPSPEALLERGDINLVHLATPPSTHAPLGLHALRAGKHVLCEKPLALTMEDAGAMVQLANAQNRVLAVNLIMRYNPLCEAVKQLIVSRLLGNPLFAQLVNVARDEPLGPGHWFWDRSRSGGIFVEHGVHFFDLFEYWFGPGHLLSAEQLTRPGTSLVDQVACSVRYGTSTLGHFYHGFHQLDRGDRQSWKIVFEMGTLTMSEWVPVSMELEMYLAETGLADFRRLLPSAEVNVVERYEGAARQARSYHQNRTVDLKVSATLTAGLAKMPLYGAMLRDLMADQGAAIRDPAHERKVSGMNGLTSLASALAAQKMADLATPLPDGLAPGANG